MKHIIALLFVARLAASDCSTNETQTFTGRLTDDGKPTRFIASGIFQTPILEGGEIKPAGGVQLGGMVYKRLWVQAELIQSAMADSFIDRTALHLLYHVPLTHRVHGLAFAGPAWDAEDKEHGIEVGSGAEYHIGRAVISATVRWQKDDTDSHIIVPTIGAGWRF